MEAVAAKALFSFAGMLLLFVLLGNAYTLLFAVSQHQIEKKIPAASKSAMERP